MSVSPPGFLFRPPHLQTDSASRVEIVELTSLRPEDLEALWSEEHRHWKDVLFWDSEPVTALVRAAIGRRRLPGKVILVGGRVVGCGYYLIDRSRAVLGCFTLAEGARTSAVVSTLARSLLTAMQSQPEVYRVETQFVPFDLTHLPEPFREAGFQEYERAFLRNELPPVHRSATDHCGFEFEQWAPCHASPAAALMQKAHLGSVDAQMNEMYRTQEGCRNLLDNIITQRGCGQLIPSASYVLRRPRRSALSGFLLTTEISAGHAHLAQVAVSPSAQGLGLGRLLLQRAFEALVRAGYRSVSLMVSETNQRALSLYESLGFRTVLRFPVFSWDRQAPGSR